MDLLLLLLLSYSVSTASSLSSDGVALLSLFKHWTSVPGEISSSWNASHSTPCKWVGIDCDNAHNVVSLSLSRYGISGSLGSEIGSLRHLHTVDLSFNEFFGVIPQGLGINSSLVSLTVCYNKFTGKIPPNLCHGKQLRLLYMAFNRFEGSIPSGVGSCSSLTRLYLEHNYLTGGLPQFAKNLNLAYIDISNNEISGGIPSSLGNCSNLTAINLSMNKLIGVIPQGIGINSSLVSFDVTNNNFTGKIPPNLCFGKKLVWLNMGGNRFQGNIPSDVGICSTLSSLNISNNEISGEIPSSLRYCSNLSDIDLSMNKLAGLIPQELGNLSELRVLNLSGNNLVGPLPSHLSNFTKMYWFDVGSNLLNGSIPSTLRSWRRLSTLILSDNRFTGGIPPFLSELEKLSELQLGGNLLGGVIPSSIGELQSMSYILNLSKNALTGQIPSELGKLINLNQLDMSHNNLTGTLIALYGMHSLTVLDVSYNNFTGAVSETLIMNTSWFSILGNPYLYVDYNSSCGSTCAGNNRKGLSKVQIAFIALGSSIFVVFGLVCLFLLFKKTKHSTNEGQPSLLHNVMEATENFNDDYIIGRGAHGTVYKASLPYGDFAVKRIVFAGQDGRRLTMFREIQTLGKIRHRNLVKLEDFWFIKDYGLILYAYMENGSLHDVLHEIKPPPTLEWEVRYKIALGTAYGLAYIHHDCGHPILHRDIKPRNILLDSKMEAHVADFGIAKLLDQSSTSTTPISAVGTTGYIAPENAYRAAKSTEKSDVYSYGVVLLELITRKKALDPSFVDQTDLVRWVTSMWSNAEEIDRIVDSSLEEELQDSNIMEQVGVILRVALMCTNNDPSKRPTMREVVNILLDVKAPWASPTLKTGL